MRIKKFGRGRKSRGNKGTNIRYCVVQSCTNVSKICSRNSISFHRLPQDKEKLHLWTTILKFKDNMAMLPPMSRYVCSAHFRADDIKKVIGKHQREFRYLKPDALPIAHGDIEDVGEEVREYYNETSSTSSEFMGFEGCDVVKEEYKINENRENSVAVERIFEDQKLQDERQEMRNTLETHVINSLTTPSTSGQSGHAIPQSTVEEQMANAYGEYIKKKFKDWDVPKQILAFKTINDAIAQFERNNK